MSEPFLKAVEWLLSPDIEGEHSNDPQDRGGDTWYGLARKYHRELPWPPTKAQAVEEYRVKYWNACRCSELPPWLAVLVFDAAVQHAPGDAVKFLQEVSGATIDGHFGPQTLRLANRLSPSHIDEILALRARYYTELVSINDLQRRFALGWHRRLFLLQRFILEEFV